jgi:hypothetical protein
MRQIARLAKESLIALADGPPQYGGPGWSGASSGQDPSEVLGGPAAASVEIGRSQPTSGRSGGPAGVRRLVCPARSGGESVRKLTRYNIKPSAAREGAAGND